MYSPRSDLEINDETLEDELAVIEVENALTRLDGIEAVRLVPGTNRPVDELHVVVLPERDPKQTVRDVQTLLVATFGLDIDRRVISVVQLPGEPGKRLRDGLPRVELDSVQIEVRGGETSVTVELRRGENTILGCAGPATDDALPYATAEATLDAIVDLLPETALRLRDVTICEVGSDLVAVAVLGRPGEAGRNRLSGSAFVHRHEADAVARAVLDATNRLQRD